MIENLTAPGGEISTEKAAVWPNLKLPPSAQEILRCPVCRSKLTLQDNRFQCIHSSCANIFPIVDGVPILINEQASIFSIDDFANRRDTTFELDRINPTRGKRTILRAIKEYSPNISKNYGAAENYARFTGLLKQATGRPRLLVVGGGIEGAGAGGVLADPAIETVETDVSFGPRTMLICDGHDLPFDGGAFDGVIIQAVLEHVVDPQRCVEEVHRVTRNGGLVYAETPFIQQVHMGQYDFTRFTHLGHRRLFRKFEEVDSGPICGPGMALAWTYQAFLMSFFKSRFGRGLARRFAAFTGFWLKYLDYFLIRNPTAYDAASGFFFCGRKKDGYLLDDRDLLTLYKGAQ
ncbi:MAG: methyltransferase domain-containing protein [Anaerolineae bacterium]